MLGKGDGSFKPPVEYSLPPGAELRSVALTDFDTDEDLDVVTAGGTTTPQIFSPQQRRTAPSANWSPYPSGPDR